ncbi:MAG: hypothetical protein MZV64_48720 [Ignavibacteriales bacterium]|nr:hypothetical protein [Ignavibacteriales bacterium]
MPSGTVTRYSTAALASTERCPGAFGDVGADIHRQKVKSAADSGSPPASEARSCSLRRAASQSSKCAPMPSSMTSRSS